MRLDRIMTFELQNVSVCMHAHFPQGYHSPRAFIAAQSPMKTTVDDFWNLIAEKQVQIVLLLCQLVEDSQVSRSGGSLHQYNTSK